MTSNVVTLPRRDGGQLIWACDCGCTVHYHHATGDVECGSCGNIASGATPGWRVRLPDEPAEPPALDSSNFKVIPTSTADVFLRRQIKEDARHPLVAVFAIFEDGGASTWAPDIDSEERRAWLERQLTEALRRIAR